MNEEINALRNEVERMKVMIGILTDRLKQVDPAGVREIRDLFFDPASNDIRQLEDGKHQSKGNVTPVANETNLIKGNATISAIPLQPAGELRINDKALNDTIGEQIPINTIPFNIEREILTDKTIPLDTQRELLQGNNIPLQIAREFTLKSTIPPQKNVFVLQPPYITTSTALASVDAKKVSKVLHNGDLKGCRIVNIQRTALLLKHLCTNMYCSIGIIQPLTGFTTGGLGKMMILLRKRGLIKRKRYCTYYLTDKGLAILYMAAVMAGETMRNETD